MTIRQQGGIFGRNPTFNNVGVDGILTAAQNIVMADGKGIDFSATAGTGTSELFDDYEEGTWTPVFTGSSGNPTVTYTNQFGIYTKIGRQVTIFGELVWTAYSGGAGVLYISGLPFTSSVINGITYYGGTFNKSMSSTNWGGYTQLSYSIQAGQSRGLIVRLKDLANQSYVGHTAVGASGELMFTASYFV